MLSSQSRLLAFHVIISLSHPLTNRLGPYRCQPVCRAVPPAVLRHPRHDSGRLVVAALLLAPAACRLQAMQLHVPGAVEGHASRAAAAPLGAPLLVAGAALEGAGMLQRATGAQPPTVWVFMALTDLLWRQSHHNVSCMQPTLDRWNSHQEWDVLG
jgi:hypothetical protein